MKKKLPALVATAIAAVSLGAAIPTAGAANADPGPGCTYQYVTVVIDGIAYTILVRYGC